MLVHLPDEVCEICGEEIPAQCFTEHWNHCGLETRREMLEDDCTHHTDSCPRNIYWMEASSGSSNNLGTDGGHKCKRGRCLLCEQQINFTSFLRHMKNIHVEIFLRSYKTCIKCSLTVTPIEMKNSLSIKKESGKSNKYLKTCNSGKLKKGSLSSKSSKVIKSTRSSTSQNKETISSCDDNNVEFVVLWMNYCEKSPISQGLRLKSSATVFRAMKKFSRIIEISLKKLKFYWWLGGD